MRSSRSYFKYSKTVNLISFVISLSLYLKYTKLYPNATIEAKDDWSKYGGSYRIVEVKFESGSYVQFKLDTYNLKEYLYKKHDAEFEKLTTEEVDSTPMEGFVPSSVDSVLGLQELGLRSVVVLPLGYRDTENDYLASLKKVRWDNEKFFIKK